MTKNVYFCLLAAACLCRAADLRYWIEPCEEAAAKCASYDPQMAEWALQDWQRVSGGKLKLERTSDVRRANIRVYWAVRNQGLYGEARAFQEGNLRGAEVYILPDLSAMGRDISTAARFDPLLRDAIVYLTCLHETGHALGLGHTDEFDDIMYSFQFGGDIPEYFGRYRRRLTARADIAKTSAISPNDRARLPAVLARW